MKSVLGALGVRPVINAAGTLTRLGGVLMDPEVVAAMAEAARHFIDMEDAQARVGARTATLLGVPAAHVCAGASAGIVVATAACLTGDDPARIAALPAVTGPRREVIVHRSHRNDYDRAVRVAGAELVEIGNAGHTSLRELDSVIGPATAAILLFEAFAGPASLSLSEVVAVARRHGVPVIVDAAAELPPLRNLAHFLEAGADLAIFSGGKDIGGPQTTGLLVGRPDLVRAAAMNASPHASVGRSMKVGKEELAGFLRAIEIYVARDHGQRLVEWEAQVAHMVAALEGIPSIRVFRKCPVEGGIRPAHIPRAYVAFEGGSPAILRSRAVDRLWRHDPPIAVGEWEGGLALNPQTLGAGEERVVGRALAAILREITGGR